MYKTITGNKNIPYCEFNIDKDFLIYLRKDMDQDSKKKKVAGTKTRT